MEARDARSTGVVVKCRCGNDCPVRDYLVTMTEITADGVHEPVPCAWLPVPDCFDWDAEMPS
jgi:hypothetical protein